MSIFSKFFSPKKTNSSYVEIENSYFGNGVLVKDPEKNIFTGIKSGFDEIDSFGNRKPELPCDLYEVIVKEDNIEYVLSSLEKIYKNSEQMMESCYNKIYEEITKLDIDLKDEFNLDYLKENWYLNGLSIYDENVEFSIGIKAADNPEDNRNIDIIIYVDYRTQEPEATLADV